MPRRFPLIPLLTFAVALAIATFFMGDIGVYNDDHFCNQRDPVTGEVGALVMNRPWPLWRPLTRVVLTPLVTTLWPHPWILHAIDAALHAAIVAMLYGLLRRFRVGAGIAAPIALAFMVYPAHFEAVLWIAITCTLLSVILMLAVWHGYLWWLERAHAISGTARAGALALLGLAAFGSACFNEQPSGTFAALALAPGVVGLASAGTTRRRVVRSFMPVVAVSIAMGAYLHGYFGHMSARVRGEREAATAAALPDHLRELIGKIPGEMALTRFASGAFREGLIQIEAHPVRAATAFGLLGVLGLVWSVRPGSRGEGHSGGVRPWLALGALGLAWSVFSWVPVAAAHTITSPRLHYVSSMGLAIAAGAALMVCSTRLGRLRRAATIGARGMLGAATVCALVVWIGIQHNFQRRCAMDEAEIEPLARIFGPTLEPRSYLIPVRLDSRSAMTGSARFDDYFQHCWYWNLASGWHVQAALHRSDVHTVVTGGGAAETGLWLDGKEPERFGMFRVRLAFPVAPNLAASVPRYKDFRGGWRRIAWDRVVLFDVAGAGRTEVYTKIRLHPAGREAVEIVPQTILGAPRAAGLPEKVLDVYPKPAEVQVTGSSGGT